ncbi:Non-specific serine/threonine protein kinase [Bertholletia excelsa]
MCKTKMAVDAAEPTATSRTSSRTPSTVPQTPTTQRRADPSTSNPSSASYSTGSSHKFPSSGTTASASSRTSLSSLRESLPEKTHIYDFAEIRKATNNFLAKRYSSSSTPSWLCNLRGRDVIVFQRKFQRQIEMSQLRQRLSVICRSHHTSIIKILGISISDDYIYLVYEFTKGANLSDCLRNPNNRDFTVLSTWMSRMQIAADLAHGLDYIHNNTGLNISLVHKYIKSSSIIVTEPSFNAKICHFGAAELCGETAVDRQETTEESKKTTYGEIEEDVPESPPKLKRSGSIARQFEGVRGYMSPEFQKTGVTTQKSDVYAFGVVILELLSGKEPVQYKYDRTTRDYRKISLIDGARDAVGDGGDSAGDDGGGGGEQLEARLRRWMDSRLRDSFPVEVAERLIRVALECVNVDPDKRPSMGRVAGKTSKLYLDSKKWSEKIRVPTDFSVSFAPR